MKIKEELSIVELRSKISITLDEAVKLTSIGKNQLSVWARNDPDFPSTLIGNKTIIVVDELFEYLKNKVLLKRIARPRFPKYKNG